MNRQTSKNISIIFLLFIICEIGKDFEFLILKTDQTFLAENIFCKIFMIIVILISLKKWKLSWKNIGFQRKGILHGLALGLTLGLVTFSAAYAIEFLILRNMGLHPRFSFYISNFSISGQNVTGISAAALLICLAGNVFNVWAEEGLFRGLLFRLAQKGRAPWKANLLQAALFGFWHVIIVVVWVFEGSLNVSGAFLMAAGYIVLAGILGYEWGLCVLLTGTVWTGVFEHFFNNFLSNALHVVTETGADELQIIRIVLSNLFSLSLVLLLSFLKRRRH